MMRCSACSVLLYAPHETEDFETMRFEKIALQLDVTSRKMIMNAVARRTHCAVRTLKFWQPLPSALVKNRPIVRAHGACRATCNCHESLPERADCRRRAGHRILKVLLFFLACLQVLEVIRHDAFMLWVIGNGNLFRE